MRFSGELHSMLYLIVIFIMIFYFLASFTSFSGIDIGITANIALGQVDNDKGVNNENSPKTIINAAIDGDNNAIVNNGSTTSNSMKFSFSGTDKEGRTIYQFECSLDSMPFVTCVSTNTVNVIDGTHTFSVRSEDNAGNKDSTPAYFTWTANTETSNTQIDSVTDGNKMIVANNSNTRSNSMTFAFSGTDNVGAKIYRFECSMNGAPFVTCISTNTVNVVDGTHTFSVRSEDNAGNKDSTPASYTWTANTETSNTQIDSASDGNDMIVTNNSNTRSNSMTFAFSGTDNIGSKIYCFECSLDSIPFVNCVSTNTVNVIDGTHTFSVRSEDNAGNKDSTPAYFTWTVDTTAPTTSIVSAVDGNNNTISNNGNSESNSIKFTFNSTDAGGVGIDGHQCNIDNSRYVACTSPFIFPNLLRDGSHTFSVLSQDNAGNKDSTPAYFTWTVDTTAPTTSIVSAVDGNNNTISNNGNSESTSIKFTFNSTDKGVGVGHLEC